MVHGCQWIFSDCGQHNATAIHLGMVSATHTNRDSGDDLELGLPDYIVIIVIIVIVNIIYLHSFIKEPFSCTDHSLSCYKHHVWRG